MADNDALLTNQMPHSPQAEQAVLGSMLIDADCVKDVMDQLQTQDFYLRTNRDIFETIYQMFVYSKPIDGVTVAGEMEKNGKSNEQTRSYLVQLMEVTPTSAATRVSGSKFAARILETSTIKSEQSQSSHSFLVRVENGLFNLYAPLILFVGESKNQRNNSGSRIGTPRPDKITI